MTLVTDIAGGDTHVEDELLSMHFLGELDPAQSDEVHRHLESCPACAAKADEVVEVMAALALDLTEEPAPAPAAPSRPVEQHVVPTGPRPASRPAARPKSARSASVRPSGGSRRRRLLTSAALLVLVLAVGGLGVSALIRGSGGPGVAIVNVGASAAGLTVRVTVTGLTAGEAYVLYAVTSDGQTHEVVRWTSRSAVEPVEGRLPGAAVRDLSFVTVSTAAGSVVVTVNLPHPAPTD
jgi:anti-sigma factor RsiW